MRTRWKHAGPGEVFPLVWQERDLHKAPMSDAMMTVLAGAGVAAVIIHNKDDSRTIYTAIEYECEVCGSYKHQDGDCLAPSDEDEY